MYGFGGVLLTNYYLLNRFFTQNAFSELIYSNNQNGIFNRTVEKYIQNPNQKTNIEVIDECYNYLIRNYQNEYFYKNTILNKLLLGVHSINTTSALSEFSVSKSKADFILINGKAVVYEIKTGLDNFERLETQLNDYYKAFKYVFVVTDEENYYPLYRFLKHKNPYVGIYVLTKRNTLSHRKDAIEKKELLDYETIFKTLRKYEFEEIILNYYSNLPNVPAAYYYKECLNLFTLIPIDALYDEYLKILKKRNKSNAEAVSDIPYSIRSLIYFSNFSKQEIVSINDKLQERFGA